ncbi:E2F-associated phosphoprotein [Synchiropus splendidus]|uniref:E2F-associated phosphoprotein n=1 Tax=Synchiropus splendidus TaxID=270530 RepID=UPI00237DEF91|nr:E2F-associated phosphoprotein [Synchiropus splendidus]
MNTIDEGDQHDSYELEEDSDEDRGASSSEDELDVLLNGTPDQKRKLIREYLTGESESSSGDDFEKEMEAELSSTIKTMEGSWRPAVAAEASTAAGASHMYDKVYFDSDSDEEEAAASSSQQTGRRRIPTNDELLYDPDQDDRDQAWVDARRNRYANRKRPSTSSSCSRKRQTAGSSSSDAVLNCPACMTTLCLDCQRHEKYRTQYRAMFVMNCTIKKEEVLRYQTKKDRRARSQKKKSQRSPGASEPTPAGMSSDEVYHPVQCSECSTEVAVLDKDEVFHFFNILASHC